MDWQDLDGKIGDLERSIPSVPEFSLFLERHDWRPALDLCAAIQDGFKQTRYPTREARDAAWQRFCELRDTTHQRRKLENAQWAERSDEIRRDILELVRRARWSRVLDAVFFFDPTSRSEMKQLGGLLSQARSELSRQKGKMLGAHKQECFQAIGEAQATHDEFWERSKAAHAARQAEHRDRQAAWEERQQDRKARIRANIASNREKLARARDALRREEDRIDELRDKIRGATTSKWEAIFEGWLAEAHAKKDNIESHMDRLRQWISEGEDQLEN